MSFSWCGPLLRWWPDILWWWPNILPPGKAQNHHWERSHPPPPRWLGTPSFGFFGNRRFSERLRCKVEPLVVRMWCNFFGFSNQVASDFEDQCFVWHSRTSSFTRWEYLTVKVESWVQKMILKMTVLLTITMAMIRVMMLTTTYQWRSGWRLLLSCGACCGCPELLGTRSRCT